MADSRRLLLSLIDKLLDDVRSAAAERVSLGRVVAHICHIDIGDAQSAAVYLKERGLSGHADRLTRDVGDLLQKTDGFRGPFVAEPTDDDRKQEERYLSALRSKAHRLFRFLDELRSLVDEDDDAVTTECESAVGGEATPRKASKPNQGTPTVPPAGHSDTSKESCTKLREIAAKVRQVAGAFNEEELHVDWKGWIALGPLFKEAYEVGAWQREGSQIGDRLKQALTAPSRDRQTLLTHGLSTPVWKIDAYFAVVGPLVDMLTPVDGEKENLEFEAGIAADAIEEEAKRIEMASDEGPDFSGAKKHSKFYEFCWEQGLREGCTERAMEPVRNDWNKKFGRHTDSTGRLKYPTLPDARACRKGYLEALKRAKIARGS